MHYFIEGIVKLISPALTMEVGPTVFIELLADKINNLTEMKTVYIALANNKSEAMAILQLNHFFRFFGNWSNVKERKVNDRIYYWYFVNGTCKVTLINDSLLPSNNLLSAIDSPDADAVMEMKFSDFARPESESSAYRRYLYANNEMTVVGTIYKIDSLGWVEINHVSFPQLLHYTMIRSTTLFFVHLQKSETMDLLQKGVAVRVSSVLPIYLWGELSGFAITARSLIEVVPPPPPSGIITNNFNINDKNKNCNTYNDMGITSSNSSHHNASHGSNKTRSSKGKSRFDDSKDITLRCHIYAAWRAYMQKIYPSCLLSDTDIGNTVSNSSSSGSKNSSRTDAVHRNPSIPIEVVQYVQSSISIATKTGYSNNPTIEKNSNSGSSSSSSSSNNSSCSSSSSNDSTQCNSTWRQSEADGQSFKVLTLLPVKSLLSEFVDPHYMELFNIRAGCDADWLSSRMPKIYNSSSLITLKRDLIRARRADGTSHSKGLECKEWHVFQVDLSKAHKVISEAHSSSSSSCPSESNRLTVVDTQSSAIIGTVTDLKEKEGPNGIFVTMKLQDEKKQVVDVHVRGPVSQLGQLCSTGSLEDSMKNRQKKDSSTNLCPCLQSLVLVAVIKQADILIERDPKISASGASKLFVIADALNIQLFPSTSCRCQGQSSIVYSSHHQLASIPVRVSLGNQHQPYCTSGQAPNLMSNESNTNSTRTQFCSDSIGVRDLLLILPPPVHTVSQHHPYANSGHASNLMSNESTGNSTPTQYGSESIGVRELLLLTTNTPALPSLTGIVVFKGLLAEDKRVIKYNNYAYMGEDTYYKRQKIQEEEKCHLVLRDERYAEVVAAYLPISMAATAVVGFKVVLLNTAITVSVKGKVYLKADGKRATRIELLGCVDAPQLEVLAVRSHTKPQASQPDENKDYITPAPRRLISHLNELATGRAFWMLTGQVVFVKKVSAQIKCMNCKRVALPSLISGCYQCPDCKNKGTVYPHWKATVAFDDGTGECVVYLDGGSAVTLLQSANSKAFASMRELVEERCMLHGIVAYDSYFHAYKVDSADGTKDNDSFSDDEDHIPLQSAEIIPCGIPSNARPDIKKYVRKACLYNNKAEGNGYKSYDAKVDNTNINKIPTVVSAAEAALHKYVTSMSDFSTTQLTVKVFKNKNQIKEDDDDGDENIVDGVNVVDSVKRERRAAQKVLLLKVSKTYNMNKKLSIKEIKVPQNNDDKPHTTPFTTLDTLTIKRPYVEAVIVKVMTPCDIRLEAWRQLKALQARVR